MASMQGKGEQAVARRQLALSWHEDDIISVFNQTPQLKPDGHAVTGFLYPPNQPIAYVKFVFPLERMAEVKNQEYAFKALQAMPPHHTKGILIPEIYRTFQNSDRLFIIMEYVPGRTLAQLQERQDWESRQGMVIESIARAIRLLLLIQPPPEQKPGPVGGGRIRHPLFKHSTSYRAYSSVDELEKHLNVVCYYEGPPPPMSIVKLPSPPCC